jgi:hypothetical protein
MWQYLFLVVYLREKDETEMDGLESYVCGRIEEDDTSWFPQMKACVLQSGEGDKSDLQNIQAQLHGLSAEQAVVRNVRIVNGCCFRVGANFVDCAFVTLGRCCFVDPARDRRNVGPYAVADGP